MSATATALPPRLDYLRDLVIREGGEWTPARVERAYYRAGWDAPKRATHRHDLDALHRIGVLDRHDGKGRRYYTRRTA